MCSPGASRISGFFVILFGLVSASGIQFEDSILKLEAPLTFTDQWAVHVDGGENIADTIAAQHGFTNLGKIFGDYYHFQHRKVAKRSIAPSRQHNHLLNSDPQIRWAQQQVVKRRTKRDISQTFLNAETMEASQILRRAEPPTHQTTSHLNDPNWSQMWYLNRGRDLDMNVQEAWAEGVTGKGLVVTILDDGLEENHPDIQQNYDAQASFDFNDNDNDPMPRYDETDSNRHGTRCAGEVAAVGNNSVCGVGIAFNARIGGVRMLDGDVTDIIEARSLSLKPQHIDIYSASWGPDDDGKTVDGPGELATRAFIEGVTKGRGGRGSIFVWASGNGGRERDNCNCDGYTNSIWTLSISSATEKGFVPWYSEACASTLAATYSSGAIDDRQIVTTDLHHSCTSSHTGTSASAPLAAGICALALEANRNLTWRDMQHIVVRTARPDNLRADDWQVNGAGRKVSHWFGYGLMDAAAMVRLGRTWLNVSPQKFCQTKAGDSNIRIGPKHQIVVELVVHECKGVNFMEHVQARINLAAVNRGDMAIFLTSPSGTRSTLLARRPHDVSHFGFHSWPFMSVHYWGEKPFGVWTLEVHNEGTLSATLEEWNIVLYGTSQLPGTPMQEFLQPPEFRPVPVFQPESNRMSLKDVLQQPIPDGMPLRQSIIENTRGAVSSVPFATQIPEPISFKSNKSDNELCRPGQWDKTTSSCFDCVEGAYLSNGQCVAKCPITSHPTNRTDVAGKPTGSCNPCHYSCLTCKGPSDSDCTSCYPDSELRSVVTPGSDAEPELYCHPRELVKKLNTYERWFLGIEMALVFNVGVVVCLLFYVSCFKDGCKKKGKFFSCCSGEDAENRTHPDYRRLRSFNPRAKSTNMDQPPVASVETRRPSYKLPTSLCDDAEENN